MRKFTKPDLPREHERRFWQGIRAGLSVDEAAASAGASWSWGRRIFVRLGGVNPTKTTEPLRTALSAVRGTRRDHASSGQRPGRSCHRP